MKKVLFIVLITLLITSCNYNVVNMDKVTEACEYAYFEGQKDAINGNVRIELNSDSIYVWTQSPWDSGKLPIFNPTLINTYD